MSILLNGCIATNLIQNAKVLGLAHHYPIHITEKKQRHKPIVSTQIIYDDNPKTYINNGKHPKVNSDGQFGVIPILDQDWFKVDTVVNIYDFNGNNITWKKPQTEFQGNIDYPLSNHFSILVGISYGTINDKIYWGNRVGLNFFWEYRRWAWNLEIYYNNYNKDYEIDYITLDDARVVVNYDRVWFNNGKGSDRFSNYSIFGTINSVGEQKLFNYFLRFGVGSSQLFILKKHEINSPQQNNLYSLVSIGIFKNIFQNNRILFGHNTYINRNIDKPKIEMDAFLQYDILF
ncbi:MAG: hypothetical protein H8D42_03620 [Candidatus Marinimicrobia bacterium]|nr:hypothetical protein [Candidatus Neomarinimicrobiota bacterium]